MLPVILRDLTAERTKDITAMVDAVVNPAISEESSMWLLRQAAENPHQARVDRSGATAVAGM
jgi:hypothetical protein